MIEANLAVVLEGRCMKGDFVWDIAGFLLLNHADEIINYKRRIAKEDTVLGTSGRPFLESFVLGFNLFSLFS